MYKTHLKQYDILKNKTYETTERKLLKEQEKKFREYERKLSILEQILKKRKKFREYTGTTEEETNQWFLSKEKEAARKWNKENRIKEEIKNNYSLFERNK
jgi:Uma2 family endonuclease